MEDGVRDDGEINGRENKGDAEEAKRGLKGHDAPAEGVGDGGGVDDHARKDEACRYRCSGWRYIKC